MSDDPLMTLLEAVAVLHARGFEQVRIHPTVYATGRWRCSLARKGADAARDPFFPYSSGGWWDYFGDGTDAPITSDALADKFERLLTDADRAPDAAYRFCYERLVEHCTPEQLPYLYDDYNDCEGDGFVGITGTEGTARDGGFPLPPG